MNQLPLNFNPYEVLEISPTASNKEITIAFTKAMKLRKHPPRTIAQARKSLMNPQERIVADYLLPIIPPITPFIRSDCSSLNSFLETLEFLAEFNNLAEEITKIDSISDEDKTVGEKLFI